MVPAPPLPSVLWHTADGMAAADALQLGLYTVVGQAMACTCSTAALLVPWPQLAARQVALRIAAAHRIAARLHAVLTVSLMQSDEPTALNNRATTLLNLLDGSLANLEALARVAWWEYLLLRVTRRQVSRGRVDAPEPRASGCTHLIGQDCA